MRCVGFVCFPKESKRKEEKRRAVAEGKKFFSSSTLDVWLGKKRRGKREGEKRKKKKNLTAGSLSPLPYLYLTLILELHCFFWRFLRGRDSSPLPLKLSSSSKQTGRRKEEPSLPPSSSQMLQNKQALGSFHVCELHIYIIRGLISC